MTLDIAARYGFAIELAREAGALASGARRSRTTLQAKAPMDYATQADHDVEALIRRRIADRFGDAVIGEEAGGAPADLVWVVDPIDGTVNYIHGTARWCISIGLLLAGQPEIGVIHAPDRDRLFSGRRGHGAFLNGAPISVSHLRHGASPVVETGWSARVRLAGYVNLITRLVNDGIEFRRHGSGALGLADVACGQNDGYLEAHINSWDVLAGLVLVREAGGWINPYLDDDGLIRGNQIVACTPEISDRLMLAMGASEEVSGP